MLRLTERTTRNEIMVVFFLHLGLDFSPLMGLASLCYQRHTPASKSALRTANLNGIVLSLDAQAVWIEMMDLGI